MAIPKLQKLDNIDGKQKNVIKAVLIGVVALLLGAFGLEAANTDFDMGKLISGKSLDESRVLRDKEGNIVENGGKYTDEYNCDDFETQPQAQSFFTKAGGPSKDTNRLDGDDDNEACESLRKTEKDSQ